MTDESLPQAPTPTTPEPRRSSPLIYWGALFGFAASGIGLAIFILGCAGYLAPFALYWLPLALAAVGMVATVLGGVLRHAGVEHTAILASLFVNLFGLVGGLLECAVHKGWDIFYRAVRL